MKLKETGLTCEMLSLKEDFESRFMLLTAESKSKNEESWIERLGIGSLIERIGKFRNDKNGSKVKEDKPSSHNL